MVSIFEKYREELVVDKRFRMTLQLAFPKKFSDLNPDLYTQIAKFLKASQGRTPLNMALMALHR